MDEPYIPLILTLILNIYLIIILRLKGMACLRSPQKLESKITQNRMKIAFQKNRENGRILYFSLNGKILLKHKLIYENGCTGIKIKPLNINLGVDFLSSWKWI